MDSVPIGYWRLDEPEGSTEAKDSGMWALQNRRSLTAASSSARGAPVFGWPSLQCVRDTDPDTGGGHCVDFTRATVGLVVPPAQGFLPSEQWSVEVWAMVQAIHSHSTTSLVAVSSITTGPFGDEQGFEIGVCDRHWYFKVGSKTLAGPLVEDGIPAHIVGVFANGKTSL